MGYLPREVTVPVGALATFAVLWIVLCAIAVAGAAVAPGRARDALHLLAPPLTLVLLVRPLPWGIGEASVWATDPALMRGFGPLLVVAALATIAACLARRRARSHAEPHPAGTRTD